MHHVELDRIVLKSGAHPKPGYDSVCLLEAAAWWAEEPHSDHPVCVSPVLAAFGRSFNDELPDADRQRLVPYITRLVGTAGDPEADEARAWMATDWLVRTFTPVWLRKAGLNERADEVAALPELTSTALAESALAVIERARKAAGDAARGAAGDAAWDAASRDAARAAASAAAGDAAWDAASRDAARAAAWAAARDAARAAAWAAAGDAAWDAYTKAKNDKYGAAYRAARAILDEALAETRVELTDSAFALFDRMIDARVAVARV